MKSSKGFKVNVSKGTITPVEIKDLNDMQEVVGGYIEKAHEIFLKDTVLIKNKATTFYVNEERLFDGSAILNGLAIKDSHQPFFAGNCLVIGTDYKTGNTIDCPMSLEEIRDVVSFRSLIRGLKE